MGDEMVVNFSEWLPAEGGYGDVYERIKAHLGGVDAVGLDHAGLPQGESVRGYSPELLQEMHEAWHRAAINPREQHD